MWTEYPTSNGTYYFLSAHHDTRIAGGVIVLIGFTDNFFSSVKMSCVMRYQDSPVVKTPAVSQEFQE